MAGPKPGMGRVLMGCGQIEGPIRKCHERKNTAAPGQRQLRVGEEIRHALTRIIARDGSTIGPLRQVGDDHRSSDQPGPPERHGLRRCRSGAALTDGEAVKPLVKALNRAGAYFRGQLAREVKLQFTPSINFKADRVSAGRAGSRSCCDPPWPAISARDDEAGPDGPVARARRSTAG